LLDPIFPVLAKTILSHHKRTLFTGVDAQASNKYSFVVSSLSRTSCYLAELGAGNALPIYA